MSTFRRRLLANQAQRAARGDLIYPGLVAAWSAKGKTNEDEDRNILKDLTGHSHDITLNNFAFSQMSGYGGYTQNYNQVQATSSLIYQSSHKITVQKSETGGQVGQLSGKDYNNSEYTIRVTTANSDGHLPAFILTYGNTVLSTQHLQEGINHIKKFDDELFSQANLTFFSLNGFPAGATVTIEQIPEYPDALVFDGVDDYGVCTNMPIQNDYTFIFKSEALSETNWSSGIAFSKRDAENRVNGAFVFFKADTSSSSDFYYYNYGGLTTINNLLPLPTISFSTKESINSIKLKVGNDTDSNRITIGALSGKYECGNMAFYSAYLFDHSLPESEIKSFIRQYIDPQYLLPSEIPTPDCYYDFSLGSNDDENRETIVDQSGNGNDAKAYNFSWSGMSGYNGYPVNFEEFTISDSNSEPETYSKTKTKITFLNSSDKQQNIWKQIYNPPLGSIIQNQYTINITGLPDTQSIVYEWRDGVDLGNRHTMNLVNGINTIPKIEATIQTELQKYISIFEYKTKSIVGYEITIELLPEYPGALVLDGVDDCIKLEAFNSGFKTMFMLCKPFTVIDKILYDQRPDEAPPHDYALYCGSSQSIGYKERNINDTYINNKINTTYTAENLTNKKQLISIKSNLTEIQTPVIGANYYQSYVTDMAIYKFLGFKEALNEDQIQYVINKYNLLEGVDDLESSEI